MITVPIQVLFVDQFGSLGGGQKVLSMVIRSLDSKRFHCVAALNGKGEFRTQLSQSGIEVLALPLGDYPSQEKSLFDQVQFLLKTFLCTLYLVYFIKKKKFDVIYANGPRTFFCTTLAGLVTRLPVFWHLHSVLPAGIPRHLARFFSRWTTRIIACSQATALPLLKSNPSLPTKLVIVPNPCPFVAETVKREEALRIVGLTQLETQRVGFGMMGRITPFKGQLQFLKAAVLVEKLRKDAYFWIFGSPAPGDNDDLRYFEQLIRFRADSGLEASVMFVPRRDDIEICHSLIDILVLASQGEEGLPLCAIEALASGKPVIAPGNGGLTDILENGFNALIVNEVSPEQLAGKMVEFLNSKPKRRLFSENARSRMESWITPHAFSQRLEQILTDSIKPA
jgi:glycosyltransferase involved in cell wall biosynthesis